MSLRWALILCGAMMPSMIGCAGPPLTLYTMTASAPEVRSLPLDERAPVISVVRVMIPDALDTQDLLVRNGDRLARSSSGRWASRLSLEITDLVTARLAVRRPDALVTDQPQAGAISYRVAINISRLDTAANGTAVLDADWTIVPTNPGVPVRRDRARIVAQGATAKDEDVVALMKEVVAQLADRINVHSDARSRIEEGRLASALK